jgi:hypothetical protein
MGITLLLMTKVTGRNAETSLSANDLSSDF